MKSFWNRINGKYDLDFGDQKLSPILKSSVGISLDYIGSVKTNGVEDPLCLCFPEKFESAVWISLAILRNSFLEDYVFQPVNRIEQLELKRFDKIEIFDCTASYISHDSKSIKLVFSDGNYSTSIKINSHINRSASHRLSKLEAFQKKRKKFLGSRSAISKIIEPKESVLINSGLLSSKVLLVTGRGNLSKTKDRLSSIHVYGEPLNEVFRLGESLLLIPDLELFKNVSNPSLKQQNDFFKSLFLESYEKEAPLIETPSIATNFETLKLLVEQNNFSDQSFKELYEDFIESLDEKGFELIKRTFEKYPGPVELIPDKLRAIVLNDINLFETYQSTIRFFLSKGIPVVMVCDRIVTVESDINYYAKFFEVHPKIIRVNWNRKKIQSLMQFDNGEDVIDALLWSKCKRFGVQKILIRNFGKHALDGALTPLQQILFQSEGNEKLKIAFWKWLHPAFYAVKNDLTPSEKTVNYFISNFRDEISSVLPATSVQIRETINSILDTLVTNINNIKICTDSLDYIFSQPIGHINGNLIFIPSNGASRRGLSGNLDKVIFTGYPFNEPLTSVLINAVSTYYIPEIEILSWSQEAKATYLYLKRRIQGGYYYDHGLEAYGFPSELVMAGDVQVNDEITDILNFNPGQNVGSDDPFPDSFLVGITKSKLSLYKATESDGRTFVVKCNIVHFEQHEFMFLPHNSKILTQLETIEGRFKIKRCAFNELRQGSRIFTHKLNRSDRRKILIQALPSDSTLDHLYIWKVALEILYHNCHTNISKLESLLLDVKRSHNLKGNPSRYNISRWLFDDDLLSPDDENLTIILTAANHVDIDDSVRKIRQSYKIIASMSIQIASQLKKQLTIALSTASIDEADSFSITVNHVDIKIECRKIAALQKDSFEVDYSNTRKILD